MPSQIEVIRTIAGRFRKTLVDFEVGEAILTLGDGSNNYTMGANENFYIKIGPLVILMLHMTWSSIGSAGASNLRISGLPYPLGSFRGNGTEEGCWCPSSFAGLDSTATLNQIIGFIAQADPTLLRFARVNDNAAATFLPANGSSASGGFGGCIIYFTGRS